MEVFGHGSKINLVYDYMATDLEVNILPVLKENSTIIFFIHYLKGYYQRSWKHSPNAFSYKILYDNDALRNWISSC